MIKLDIDTRGPIKQKIVNIIKVVLRKTKKTIRFKKQNDRKRYSQISKKEN